MIEQFATQQERDGRSNDTVQTDKLRLARLAKLCNLLEPEEVKTAIHKAKWKNSTKNQNASTYAKFLRHNGLTWQKPKYTVQDEQPFIPTEAELDALIAAGNKKTAALLQTLKETAARIGEAASLKWINLDTERHTLYITAEKGCRSRTLPISPKLEAMLNKIPRKSETIFQTSKHGLSQTFYDLRNRTADKLNNPRLKHVHPHTFRHWKATVEYHKTLNLIHVSHMLGHRSTKTTEIYVHIEEQLYTSQNSEYESQAVTTKEEAMKLINSGYEYVQTMNEYSIYRKRK